MIGATLTTRLAQDGIDKKTVTAFTLAFLVDDLEIFWAWMVDGVRLPLVGGAGQRVSWMLFARRAGDGCCRQSGAGRSLGGYRRNGAGGGAGRGGRSHVRHRDRRRPDRARSSPISSAPVRAPSRSTGWRIGSTGAAALALVMAARTGWSAAYLACALFALPAMLTALLLGEPVRHREPAGRKGIGEAFSAIIGPFGEFFRRDGAWLVPCSFSVHKVGDTLANLTFRLLFDDLGFTNDEIAIWDVGVGFWAYLIGIFIGGVAFARLGLKRSALLALVSWRFRTCRLQRSLRRAIPIWAWQAPSGLKTSRRSTAA